MYWLIFGKLLTHANLTALIRKRDLIITPGYKAAVKEFSASEEDRQ